MRYTNDAAIEECALLRVEIAVQDQGELTRKPVTAAATLGDWAATPCEDNEGRWRVTHAPSGYCTGPSLTMRDAMRVVGALGREPILQNRSAEDFCHASEPMLFAILRAFPKHTRSFWVMQTAGHAFGQSVCERVFPPKS